jgi:hypothetical protein
VVLKSTAIRRVDAPSFYIVSSLYYLFSLSTMTPALLVSIFVYYSAAIAMSGMLIYHDIKAKVNSNSWERAFAVFLEICQIGLSSASIVAAVVAFRSSTEMYWYDAVILCSLQLSVGNNVGFLLFMTDRAKSCYN